MKSKADSIFSDEMESEAESQQMIVQKMIVKPTNCVVPFKETMLFTDLSKFTWL